MTAVRRASALPEAARLGRAAALTMIAGVIASVQGVQRVQAVQGVPGVPGFKRSPSTLDYRLSTNQGAQGRGGPLPAQTPRASAPIDLTGYWVSVVNEDWRYRMVTPAKGDYKGVPITQEALKIVNAWNPAADDAAGNQCKSYGAGAIMRVPGRIHLTWQDDTVLRLDTDAGMQSRLFQFGAAPAAPAQPTWQGQSLARWERPGRGSPASKTGSLTVTTTNLRAGYLRKNGVPYSDNARVTEYFDLSPLPGNGQLLVVTTIVDDPRYLTQPFVVSSHFKKEADGSRWDPTPCSSTW